MSAGWSRNQRRPIAWQGAAFSLGFGFFIVMALSSLLIDARAALSQRADELFVPVGDAGEKKIILFFSISAGRRRARVGQVVGASFAGVWQIGARDRKSVV